MKIASLLLTAASLALLAVVTTAASAGTEPKRQRIAFEGVFDVSSGQGTFTVIPLSPGALKRDSGTFSGTGDISRSVIRDGQRQTPITGADSMTGKRGTLIISQELVSATVGRGYSNDSGTWSLDGGTGAYAGYKGSGLFAAVGLPSRKVLFREEGYVTKG